MDTKIKNYLGWAGVALMAALALSSLWYVRTYSKSAEPSSYRSFSVTGEGKGVAIPDVAEFSFSVLTQGGKDLSALQAENTLKVNRAIGVVKGAGVADEDIKTEQYIFCLNGKFTLGLDDGKNRQNLIMDSPYWGVRLGKMLWHSMKNFSKDCVILVVADDYFKEEDYIRNYDEFLKFLQNKRKKPIL